MDTQDSERSSRGGGGGGMKRLALWAGVAMVVSRLLDEQRRSGRVWRQCFWYVIVVCAMLWHTGGKV